MRNSLLAFSLVPLLLAGCATARLPAQPAPALPAGGAFVTQAPLYDPAQPVPDQWWRLYDDAALDGLVRQALAANADLRVAEANLARARAVTQESRAGRLPSTDLSGGVTYGDADAIIGTAEGASRGDPQFAYSGGLALSWEADLFGRIGQAIRAAEADMQAQEAARDRVRVVVAAETTRSYVNACAAAYAADVARQSVETGRQSLDLTGQLEQAGAGSQLDVERAAAALASAEAQVPALEAQRQVALFELAALLGATPDQVPAAARDCVRPPNLQPAVLPVGDAAALLRRRPDLREAERTLAADAARIGVAAADLYPRISIGGSADFLRNDFLRGSDSLSFSIGPLLSWSFPNMAVARARLRQAEAQGEASLAAFDGRVLTALKEVEQALTNLAGDNTRIASLAEAEQRSYNAYRMADLRFRAGSVSYLDVLVAQRELQSARAAHAAAVQQLGSSQVDLFKALGGGWQAQ